MTVAALSRMLLMIIALVSVAPRRTVALGDTKVETGQCSVATGGSASATTPTITCNFGLTPEQLKQVTDAVARGLTDPLLDRVLDISKKLGITEAAAKALLRIAGEQPDVPDERLAEVLTKIAADYKRLQAQAATLDPDNPTARNLVTQAKAEIEAGHLSHARELLRQATQAQIAAAQEARKSREQAEAAEDA